MEREIWEFCQQRGLVDLALQELDSVSHRYFQHSFRFPSPSVRLFCLFSILNISFFLPCAMRLNMTSLNLMQLSKCRTLVVTASLHCPPIKVENATVYKDFYQCCWLQTNTWFCKQVLSNSGWASVFYTHNLVICGRNFHLGKKNRGDKRLILTF